MKPLKWPVLFGSLAALTVSASVSAGEPLPAVPPYEGVYQPQGVDEIGLWREADEYERKLNDSSLLVRDEKLTSYVKDVLCRTVGPDRCGSTRIYIMRVPVFNASMDVNGTMRVYSGLLLRVRNEAELASVLGHEFGHFEKRHGLQRFKKKRTGSDILAWASVLAGSSLQFQNAQLVVYGNYFKFSRDNEREADILGLSYLKGSPLRPQAASRVWQNLMNETEASARSKGLKKPKFGRVAFFASHPADLERAVYLDKLAGTINAEQTDGRKAYQSALKDWLPVFLEDQIKLNDFGGSEYIINSLAEFGWTPDLWLARGNLYRSRGHLRDLMNAANFYREALTLDSAMADAHRGLGLSLMKTGDRNEGRKALAKYLELKPEAPDAVMISMMLLTKEEE